MATWEAINGGPMWVEALAPLESAANGLNSILGPIQTILGILRSILKIIRVFLLDVTSIIIALIKTLVKQITDFIRNLGNSGIYFLAVTPDFGSLNDMLNSARGGMNGFVDKVVSSLEDPLDPFKPMFATNQKVGGVALAISTGNLMNAINFLGMFFTAIKQTYNQVYPVPSITGASGNSANIIQFERPSVPGAFFTGVKFTLERATQPGGVEVTKDQQLASTNATKNVSLKEPVVEPQNNMNQTKWETIDSVEYTNQFTAPERIIFIDQNTTAEGKAPHLIRFDLSKQADSKNLVGEFLNSNAGPVTFNVFTTQISGETLLNPTFATKAEIDAIIPTNSQSDDFRSKYVSTTTGRIVYLDFRVNGLSLTTNASTIGAPYIVKVSDNTVELSNPFRSVRWLRLTPTSWHLPATF